MAVIALMVILVVGLVGWTTFRPVATAAPTPGPPPPRPPLVVVESLPQLTEQLNRWGASGQFTGGVLVARGDAVLFRQVHGFADRRLGTPLALNSRFRLASVSKQFTAAAILRLQDDGLLSVDDPVCKWIQSCPAAWASVRLHHMLGHSSGIPDLMARPGWGVRRVTPATMEELTAESTQYGLQFPPGTKVRYNNAAYNLLGAVVEKASGKPLHIYLRTAFFEPLGMADTGYDDDASDVVVGYANLGGGGPSPQPDHNVSIIVGAGALYSTLDDLLVWQRALHHGHLLSPRSRATMIADHAPSDTPDERGRPRRDWGFGLFNNSIGQRVSPAFMDRQIFHTGSWSGFRNLVSYQPDSDVTVIVLSNNFHQREAVFLLSQQAMAEALGRPFPTAMAR
ncbi:MAG: serine hydrolase domain-containing protein [Brevundimonas sp.]|uniref:serine hydrolase domain-containing protein n=1 Tax=Brevundimonas sp. TaxID=1871086 RepID=UPI002721D2AD|nr:serine hydrolase domain-containing protein [Brevundimonas sp.]MDO9078695.1 serine hydrolase domain-containing protein [Brevundimonas sp.]MDP3081258.1 serine hydrolase domain-containing protein [Brevundimonas sp.]MDZ4062997.1 serine hydrolase domain-containing protein [Brevundimonas sp.]